MNRHVTTSLDRAFVRPGTPMFSDLILQLEEDWTLPDTRRRDVISGLRRVARAFGLPPEDVPADSRWLQPRLAKISAAALGLSTKAWQNAVSDARSALALCGIVERRTRRTSDLGPAWKVLWTLILAAKDRTLPTALRRFVHFLDMNVIQPGEVTAEHALAYREALAANEISRSPEVAYRAAVNGWNLAVRKIAQWPRQILPLPSRQVTYTLPAEAFAPEFLMDLERLMAQLAAPDIFSDDRRSKPLRPATILHYRRQLLRFASELVHAGVRAEEITTVTALLDPLLAERGLRQMLSRTGNKPSRLISETAALLRNMARTLGAPSEALSRLETLAGRLLIKPHLGMTEKNRARLRVLQDEQNQRRLLLLPERLFAQTAGRTRSYTMGLVREDALAIALLLVCPVRIANIAGIDLQRHLHRPGDGRVFLVWEAEETKNGRPMEFELPRDLVRMLDRHLAARSPELCPPGTRWLFPRRKIAGHIGPGELAGRVKKRIRRETGLTMNAHLFRHFAVMTWLDAYPGAYEAARRLLGHSEVSHTINMYSGMEVTAATRAFADLVKAKKGRRK